MPVAFDIEWPGLPRDQIRGLSLTWSGTAAPSTAQLTCGAGVPEDVAQYGVLRFGTTGGPGQGSVTLPDCARAEAILRMSGQGPYWVLPIKDRRWRWQYGHISGAYNVRRPDGSLIREKTPQELAALCFAAVDETNYDLTRLPNVTRPQVDWDHARAADALSQLVADLGCLIHLNPLTNTAEVWPVGEGAGVLPSFPGIGEGYSIGGQIRPQSVDLIAAPTEFESVFAGGEPVGLDVNGEWRPLGDLTYEPAHGWGKEWPDADNVVGTYQDPNTGETRSLKSLAAAHLWRRYKIAGQWSRGGWSPGLLAGTDDAPQSLDDVELLNGLVSTAPDQEGVYRRLPILVEVRTWRGRDLGNSDWMEYEGAVAIDAENGHVVFNEPVFKFVLEEGAGLGFELQPADVRVRCAFHAGRNGVFHAQKHNQPTGSTVPSPPEPFPFRQLKRKVIESLDGNVTFDNLAIFEVEATRQLESYIARYDDQPSGGVTYSGVIPLALDGVARQVTWSVGNGSPAKTTISLSRSHNPWDTPYEERERQRKLRELAEERRGDLNRIDQLQPARIA